MKTLIIGAGFQKKEIEGEVVTLDFFTKNKEINVIHNLDKFPYPFKNNEFDEIIAEHILEHLENLWWKKHGGKNAMDEMHRILKPGGKLKVLAPHPSVAWNYAHPTHKRYFPTNSFSQTTKEGQDKYSKQEYKINEVRLIYGHLYLIGKIIDAVANFNKFSQKLFERYLIYYLGGFDSTYFELEAVK